MKERLDKLLVNRGLVADLHTAHRKIMAGEVLVDEIISDKPGYLIQENSKIRIKEDPVYVSRGGYKLKRGLDDFHIDPSGKVCLDIGVSSGGFTDCLLQHGAGKVYAVDVGYGQIDWKLRQDPRVVLLERFNARKLTTDQIPQLIELAVIDVSFISLTKVIPPILPLSINRLIILALVKPQFELSKDKIGKGGIVSKPAYHQQAIQKITDFGSSIGLEVRGCIESPILGAKGNKEFLVLLEK